MPREEGKKGEGRTRGGEEGGREGEEEEEGKEEGQEEEHGKERVGQKLWRVEGWPHGGRTRCRGEMQG